MERYISQLIDDLKVAQKWALVSKQQNEMSTSNIMAELEEIDRVIDEKPDNPMHTIFGIDPIMFSPAEKITTKQAALLADEILQLWQRFNIDAVYPEKFPKHKLYPLLVCKFNEPFLYFPMGITGIEFCNFDSSQCPFGNEYYTCKKFDLDDNG